MTVRLLSDRPPYVAGNIVTYDAGTEAGLVAAKEASTNLSGGTQPAAAAPATLPTTLTASELAGVRALVSGAGISAQTVGLEALGNKRIYINSNKYEVVPNISPSKNAADNALAFQGAVDEVEETGGTNGAGTILLPAGDFTLNEVQIGNGFSAIGSVGYRGGVKVRGQGKMGTRLRFQGARGFVYLPTPENPDATLDGMELSDMAIIGPGVGVAGSLGISAVNLSASQRVLLNQSTFQRLLMTGFENLVALEDSGDNSFRDIRMVDFYRAFWLGYNCDKLLFDTVLMGNNLTVTTAGSDARTAIGVDYSLNSPFRPSGGLSNNTHTYHNCMFLHLAVALKITDVASAALKIRSYFEACKQYATLGANDGNVNGPKAIHFDNCHFSRVYNSGETAPKIQLLSSNNNSSVAITDCQSDDSSGANGGWVDLGSNFGGALSWARNTLPSGGSSANPWHIKYGAKTVVVSDLDTYTFRGGNRGSDIHQFNANAAQNIFARAIYAFNGDANTKFFTLGFKAAGGETAAGTALDFMCLMDGSNRYAAVSGVSKMLQGSGSPPAASSVWRGVTHLQQGGTGVADVVRVCVKDSADAYSWKAVTLT